jgi:hypothetical protein
MARAGARQINALMHVQSSLVQRVQHSSAISLKSMAQIVNVAQVLGAKLATARSPSDAVGAWQECLAGYLQYAAAEASRLLNDGQEFLLEGANALAGAASERTY